MKVLVAYDGSNHSDIALQDLQRAGLPSEADSIVLAVADVWLPEDSKDMGSSGEEDAPAEVLMVRRAAQSKVAEAASTAARGAKAIESILPWKVSSEAVGDSPAWAIISRAESWPADLIVMGARGMSATARILIGSISQNVLTHAPCSVRIARKRMTERRTSVRVIIGYDGSADADNAVHEVASRKWPEGSEALLVTALDDSLRTAIAARVLKLDPRAEVSMKRVLEELQSTGLKTRSVVTEGHPKQVLLDTARRWQPDAMFLGAAGLRGMKRLLLGSVSSGVASAAPCTVEVVRKKPRT